MKRCEPCYGLKSIEKLRANLAVKSKRPLRARITVKSSNPLRANRLHEYQQIFASLPDFEAHGKDASLDSGEKPSRRASQRQRETQCVSASPFP